MLADLRLPDGAWDVLHSGEHEHVQTTHDGSTVTRNDNFLKLRRRRT
ncbi:hypothetical protein [Actinomadura pelletieri]|nr:hypothetical protein [Actinomadura pelletieri]